MKQGEIKLIPVGKEAMHEQTVLRNLVKMYCYEWSQYNSDGVDADGTFRFEKHVSDYWTNDGYHAFFISVDEKWAGFVFIENDNFILHKDSDYSIAEFFVLYPYRHSGVGTYVAESMFDMFPGKWEIGRHPKNVPSVHFWDNVVNDYTDGAYEAILSCPEFRFRDGTLGDVLTFVNTKHPTSFQPYD